MLNDTQEMKDYLAKEKAKRLNNKNITKEEYERMMTNGDDKPNDD